MGNHSHNIQSDRLGTNLVALAAIDLATWDLYSKTLGLPLASAVGGAPRPIPVYGSGGFTAAQSALEAAHVAEGYVKRGFQAVKPRAQGNISRDSQILKAVRGAVGDGATMMVDANERCDLAGAKQLLLLARDHDVAFVEEPLPAHALSAYRALARCAPVAIATGEHLQTVADFLPYLSEGLIDVVQPDLAMMGGITPILKLCTLAETFNVNSVAALPTRPLRSRCCCKQNRPAARRFSAYRIPLRGLANVRRSRPIDARH